MSEFDEAMRHFARGLSALKSAQDGELGELGFDVFATDEPGRQIESACAELAADVEHARMRRAAEVAGYERVRDEIGGGRSQWERHAETEDGRTGATNILTLIYSPFGWETEHVGWELGDEAETWESGETAESLARALQVDAGGA
jgi:hypothetical protein